MKKYILSFVLVLSLFFVSQNAFALTISNGPYTAGGTANFTCLNSRNALVFPTSLTEVDSNTREVYCSPGDLENAFLPYNATYSPQNFYIYEISDATHNLLYNTRSIHTIADLPYVARISITIPAIPRVGGISILRSGPGTGNAIAPQDFNGGIADALGSTIGINGFGPILAIVAGITLALFIIFQVMNLFGKTDDKKKLKKY